MTLEPPLSHEIVAFWREAGHPRWFGEDADFDAEIRLRFEAVHMASAAGEYAAWERTAEGALALVLLTDQFPRNLYRGTAHAFATDPLARAVAGRALDRSFDREVDPALRAFFYIPFEHSERGEDQARALALFADLEGDPRADDYRRYARVHADVIARFGRFPHRNPVFGRRTTAQEQAFLDGGGFSG